MSKPNGNTPVARAPARPSVRTPPDEDDFAKLLSSGNLDAMIPKDLSGKDKIVHADDALDFESEDELADDDDEAGDAGAAPSVDAGASDDDGLDEIFGDAEEGAETAEMQEALAEEARQAELLQLQLWYPGFEEHTILKMNQMFAAEPSQTQLPQPKNVRPLNVSRLRVELASDTAQLFLSEDVSPESKRAVDVKEETVRRLENELGLRQDRPQTAARPRQRALESLQLEVSNWDDVLEDAPRVPALSTGARITEVPAGVASNIESLHIEDDDLYSSEAEDLILEGRPPAKRTRLDLNDAHLLFVEDAHARAFQSGDVLNVSNDRAYDMLRANYQRKVRSTIGSLNIEHSMPAERLQSPFYKVRPSKQQLRYGRRQKLAVKPGTVWEFLPLKTRKKWKDKNRSTQELFAKTGDLTLGDSGSLFLIEYSEGNPLVLSGFGMGSKLINYYRKTSSTDSQRPKRAVGETHVLEEQDKSPFWNFGFVEPGNVVPTLYNQMTRSPVFQHATASTDFLVVRSVTKARGARHFIREIPYLFVSGQLFPAVQIPGPHSRKVTAASKNRLRMLVYRVLNKNPRHRLQIRDISTIFPDYNEVQNRQRLKEFMEYQRSGEDQGFWKVKPGDHVPSEAEIRALIKPEDIQLLESMRTGQQQLEDAEYVKIDDEQSESGGSGGSGSGISGPSAGSGAAADEPLGLNEQLAPWNLSRNFINAVQGKAMLSLHGEGDPTARGEGYSFLRTSMKGGFISEATPEDAKKLGGHSYNVALQQKAYDEEISRIWNAQRASLTVTDPHKLSEADKLPTKQNTRSDKVLQITRMVKDENDIMVRRTELVTDPLVIHAYLRHRRAAEEEKMAVDQISVTNDAEVNKQSRKFLEQELARLNRNADRRQARKATKQDPKMKATTRKCATCGAVGHIKTNKSCPMYNDIYLKAAAKSAKTEQTTS